MTKVSRRKINSDQFGQYVNNLWSAFTLLNSKEDIRLLFKDIFTHTEYTMFAKRLEVARRLIERQRYSDIKEALAVGEPTIAVVSNVLATRGEGYRKVHQELSYVEEERYKEAERRDDQMSNPFRQRAKRKTVLGTVIKAGLYKLDKKILHHAKKKSVKQHLPI